LRSQEYPKKSLDPRTRSGVHNRIVLTEAHSNRPLRSGALARLAGVSPDTLRHYERQGLLPRPPRSSNGYRLYPAEALARVRLIRAALAIGFTVNDLAGILKARDRGDAPCRQVRDLAATKLADLQARIRSMEVLRDLLARTLRDWDRRLKKASPGRGARLLEHFANAHPERARQASPWTPFGRPGSKEDSPWAPFGHSRTKKENKK
jgi:DNA-binding transcriptional MerR regulator